MALLMKEGNRWDFPNALDCIGIYDLPFQLQEVPQSRPVLLEPQSQPGPALAATG